MLCPKDGKGCCDDMCYGAGCMRMDGYPMLAVCEVCKGTIDEEIPDCGTCTCDDEESWPDEYADSMPNAQAQPDFCQGENHEK